MTSRQFGAQISGDTVALIAGNVIDLRSAISSAQKTHSGINGSIGGSVGLSPALAPTSFGLSLSGGYAASNSSALTHTMARITGSKFVSIESGGDTNLNGAVIAGW